MKELTTYITEKLDINKVNLNSDFPIDSSFDDIVAFLVKNKYIKITSIDRYMFSAFNIASKKAFFSEYYKDSDWNIWFGDTSKGLLNKDNPLFLIQKEPNSERKFYYSPDNLTNPRTKEDFMKALKKYLKL